MVQYFTSKQLQFVVLKKFLTLVRASLFRKRFIDVGAVVQRCSVKNLSLKIS